MKVAVYIRVSTEDQALKGESLELQKERILEYIKIRDWKLFKIYEDAGISGGSTKRPAFQELLRDARAKLFDIACVYKIDRLSRSIVDFFNTLQLFEKQGISFVSITQQFDTSTPTGRFLMSMLASFADFERSIGIERAKDSYLRRLSNGISSGVLPYGYKREDKKVVIVPEQAEKIKQLYDSALQGISMREIARQTGISRDSVMFILSNPFYCGYLARKRDDNKKKISKAKWEFHSAQHEAIIPYETWKAVQDMRKNKKAVSKQKHTALFSKLIYCARDKHNLTYRNKNDSYVCLPIYEKDSYCNRKISESALEEKLLKTIDRFITLDFSELENDIYNIKKEIQNIDKRITRLTSMVENEIVSMEEGKEKIARLKQEKEKLLGKNRIDINLVRDRIKKVQQIYPHTTREEKALFWHIIIKRISLQYDRIHITWNINIPASEFALEPLKKGKNVRCGGDEGSYTATPDLIELSRIVS